MLRSNKGQTFFEFIFLILIMFILSFTLLKGTNFAVSKRWELIVNIVTSHDLTTPSNVQFR